MCLKALPLAGRGGRRECLCSGEERAGRLSAEQSHQPGQSRLEHRRALWAVTPLPIHIAVIIMEAGALRWHGVLFPPEWMALFCVK